MSKRNRLGFFLSWCLLLICFWAIRAQAIEYGGFGGRPAYPQADNPRTESIFIHNLEPGAVKEDGVRIVNNTAEKKTFLVYATDSTPSTGGAFACKQLSEEKTGVGSWIDLEQSEVTLEPGTNRIVPFSIIVPNNASIGEHNGCILIQEKKEKVEGQAGMNLSVRTGLRVAITIPGEIERKLNILSLTVKKQADGFIITPRISNLGNVSIDTEVEVVTRSFLGGLIAKHGGQYPILRGDISEWNFELKKPFWGGWYKTNVTVQYNKVSSANLDSSDPQDLEKITGPDVWFFSKPTLPGLLIEIAILLALIALITLIWLAKKKRGWIQKNWLEYRPEAGEDLPALAKKFKTSWKKLAKVNKLKAPYTIKTGEKIKIPPLKK